MLNDGDLSRCFIGLCLLAVGLWFAYRFLDPKRTAHRVLFSSSWISLCLLYLVWRWTETVSFELLFSFTTLWPLAFVVVETSRAFDECHAVYTLGRTTDRRGEAEAGDARLRAMGNAVPAVDVFIPTYDEPESVILRTMLGAKALDYPYFRVFVLDDGARPWLEVLCVKHGIHYIPRYNGKDAKAGNMNNGLAMTRHLDPAPFILLLDADFVPFKNFLWRTLGFFDDPTIAIVQTPQFFFNPDPLQLNLGTPWSVGDEQRLFFDVFQPSKDAFDAAFCCGSSCVMRRHAIESTGGIPTGSVIEDVHLSYHLLGHGWKTRYLNEILTNGLAPESVREFVNQRVRWAIGCAQAVFMPCGPFSRNGLSFSQRLHYLSPVLFWIHLVFLPMQILAPAIYWITGVPALNVTLQSWLNIFIPCLMVRSVFMFWASEGKIIPLWKTLQLVYALDTALSLVLLFTTGRIRATRTTQKGLSSTKRQTDWHLVATLGAYMLINTVGLWWGQFSNMSSTTLFESNEVNIFWSIHSILYCVIAMTFCIEVPRQRRDERFRAREMIDVEGFGSVVLRDISAHGARIALANAPDKVLLRWRGLPPMPAHIVRKAEDSASYRFDIENEVAQSLTTEIFTSGLLATTPERAHFGALFRNIAARFVLRAGTGR